jgi:hypothetical protein
MIGRQNLYVSPAQMGALAAAFGRQPGPAELAKICDGSDGYAENLLRFLGAQAIDSFDNSDFEGATHVHDMNRPIADEFKQRYSVVLDGGTLEHIFDFPTAIRNCMEMVRVGGHYLAITPANNFFGHGFYQFSPELYFTVLSPENGFTVESMVAFEEIERPVWRQVADPRETGGRVTLLNDKPVYLLIVARRTAVKPIFERPPQQSDYVPRWSGDAAQAAPDQPATPPKRPIAVRIAKAIVPADIRLSIRRALNRRRERPVAGFDPRFFTPIDPAPTERGTSPRSPLA